MLITLFQVWGYRFVAVAMAIMMAFSLAIADEAPSTSGTGSTPTLNFPYNLNGGVGTTPSGSPQTGISSGLNAVQPTLPEGIQRQDSATNLVLGYIGYFMSFYPYVAIGLIIYFGVRLIISRGKPDARKEALAGIINIALGTLIIYLAYGIVAFILSLTSPETARQALQT